MAKPVRIILVLAVFLAVANLSCWIPFSLIFGRFGVVGLVIDNILGTIAGAAAAIYIWRNTETVREGCGASVLKNALVIGAIGFAGGFFGPMIFSAGNQGPMLGIFITGPLGVAVGAIAGFIRWSIRNKNIEDVY